MQLVNVLLEQQWVAPLPAADSEVPKAGALQVATVLSNLAYYGYRPDAQLRAQLLAADPSALVDWWTELEPALQQMTGADRQMADVVVYKNFPDEVLAMTELDYQLAQLLIYLGCPASWFAEVPTPREGISAQERQILVRRELTVAPADGLNQLWAGLVAKSSRWTGTQLQQAAALRTHLALPFPSPGNFGFRENGLRLLLSGAASVSLGDLPDIPEATDILRMAALISGQDIRLPASIEFSIPRADRAWLLGALERTQDLAMAVALRRRVWKRFFQRVHPGDYAVPRVHRVMDLLCKKQIHSKNSDIEALLKEGSSLALYVLAAQPGSLLRRFRECYHRFGPEAVMVMMRVLPKLSVAQLLKFHAYLHTANTRKTRMFPPGGRWDRAQVIPMNQPPMAELDLHTLQGAVMAQLAQQLAAQFPEGVALEDGLDQIKLPANNQELAAYGPGTVFPIPEEVRFVRTASYWALPGRTGWFDNGWVFFSEDWTPRSACCWDRAYNTEGAVFSGDPINSDNLNGRACQLLDLDLEALRAQGIRYAVWSILSFDRIPFSDAEEVLATLQWGIDPNAGELYEPARAQLVFPLKGVGLAKQVAMLDLAKNELRYLDAGLGVPVSSAGNEKGMARLQEQLPALLEYLDAQPSYGDLFSAVAMGAQPITREDCLLGRISLGALA